VEIDRGQTVALALGAVALVAAGIGAGYWLRAPGMSAPAPSAAPTMAMQAPAQTPVYYQDPDAKADPKADAKAEPAKADAKPAKK